MVLDNLNTHRVASLYGFCAGGLPGGWTTRPNGLNPVSSRGRLWRRLSSSLYEIFPAAEARRIARRLEFHYTPKHGSWLITS